jgi:hypothetical protein
VFGFCWFILLIVELSSLAPSLHTDHPNLLRTWMQSRGLLLFCHKSVNTTHSDISGSCTLTSLRIVFRSFESFVFLENRENILFFINNIR